MKAINLFKLTLTIFLTLVFLDYNKEAGDIIFTVDASLKH